jgi:hypothetical protein
MNLTDGEVMIVIDLPGGMKEWFMMVTTLMSWTGKLKTEEIWKLMNSSMEYFPLQTLMEGTIRVAGRVMDVAGAVAAASLMSHIIANRQDFSYRASLED